MLRLLKAELRARLPRFIAGEHKTPPEDIGNPPGFEMLLEAIADPLHEEHNHLVQWYGRKFDPEDINLKTVRLMFGALAKARPAKM